MEPLGSDHFVEKLIGQKQLSYDVLIVLWYKLKINVLLSNVLKRQMSQVVHELPKQKLISFL